MSIHYSLPDAAYFDGSHYGVHAIMDAERRGLRYFHARHVARSLGEGRSHTFDLGKGAHCFTLEGEAAYTQKVAIQPRTYRTDPPAMVPWNARTKFCKEWVTAHPGQEPPKEYPDGEPSVEKPWNGNAGPCARWLAEQAALGVAIVTASDDLCIRAMDRALRDNPDTMRWLKSGRPEVAIRSTEAGLPLQCKVDWFAGGANPIDWEAIVDLKTCDDLSDFERDIFKYKYDRQGAHYQWMVEQEIGAQLPFVLVAVETAIPHRSSYWVLGDDVLERAHRLNQYQYDRIIQARETNAWPLDNPEPKVVGLPQWLRDRDPLAGAA